MKINDIMIIVTIVLLTGIIILQENQLKQRTELIYAALSISQIERLAIRALPYSPGTGELTGGEAKAYEYLKKIKEGGYNIELAKEIEEYLNKKAE